MSNLIFFFLFWHWAFVFYIFFYTDKALENNICISIIRINNRFIRQIEIVENILKLSSQLPSGPDQNISVFQKFFCIHCISVSDSNAIVKTFEFFLFWICKRLELRFNWLFCSKFRLSFTANSEKELWSHMLEYCKDMKQDFCLFVFYFILLV